MLIRLLEYKLKYFALKMWAKANNIKETYLEIDTICSYVYIYIKIIHRNETG